MHLNFTEEQKHWIHIFIIAFVLLFLITFFVHSHKTVNRTGEEVREEQDKETDAKALFNHKKAKIKRQLFMKSTRDKDPKIRAIAVNGYNNTTFKSELLRFCHIYYDWNSAKSFAARSNKLSDILTNNLLRNNHLFPRVKTTKKNGSNYIDSEQLNSEFNDLDTYVIRRFGNNITAIAAAQYNRWHGNTDKQVTSESWFQFTFDTRQRKITNIHPIYTQPRVRNPNS